MKIDIVTFFFFIVQPLAILVEFLHSQVKKENLYPLDQSLMSIGILVLTTIVNFVFYDYGFVITEYLAQHGFNLIPKTLSSNYFSIFLGTELIYYFFHRWQHHNALLWTLNHSLHHSGERINILNATRRSIFFPLGNYYMVIWSLVFLGFSPKETMQLFGISLVLQVILFHCNYYKKHPFIEKIFYTPRLHIYHHDVQRNCNFGGILNIFDRIFGTFYEAPKTSYVKCGLKVDMTGYNPVRAMFHEVIEYYKDKKKIREKINSDIAS